MVSVFNQSQAIQVVAIRAWLRCGCLSDIIILLYGYDNLLKDFFMGRNPLTVSQVPLLRLIFYFTGYTILEGWTLSLWSLIGFCFQAHLRAVSVIAIGGSIGMPALGDDCHADS